MLFESICISFLINLLTELAARYDENNSSAKLNQWNKKLEELKIMKSGHLIVNTAINKKLQFQSNNALKQTLTKPALLEEIIGLVYTEGLNSKNLKICLKDQGLANEEIEDISEMIIDAIGVDQVATNAMLLRGAVKTCDSLERLENQNASNHDLLQNLTTKFDSNEDPEEILAYKNIAHDAIRAKYEQAIELQRKENDNAAYDLFIECANELEKTKDEDNHLFIKVLFKIATLASKVNDLEQYYVYFSKAKAVGASDDQIKETSAFHECFNGNKEKAISLYRELLVIDNEVRYFNNISVLYLELDDWQGLEDWLNDVPCAEFKKEGYWASLSQLEKHNLEYEKAISSIKKAIKFTPDDIKLKWNFSYLVLELLENQNFDHQSKSEINKELVETAFTYFEECIEHFKSLEHFAKEYEETCSNLLSFALLRGKTSAYIKYADELSIILTKKQSLINICHFYHQVGDNDKALEVLNTFKEKYEISSEVVFLEYYLYGKNQRYQEVIDYYFDNEDECKSSINWLSVLGEAYCGLHKIEDALIYLEKLHENNNNYAAVVIATLYEYKKEYPKAEEYYNYYLEVAGQDAIAKNQLGYLQAKQKKWRESYDTFTAANINILTSPFSEEFLISAFNIGEYNICLEGINAIDTYSGASSQLLEMKCVILYNHNHIGECKKTILNLRNKTNRFNSLVDYEAHCLIREFNFEQAENALRAAVNEKSDWKLRLLLAKTQFYNGEFQAGIETAIAAVEESDGNIDAREDLMTFVAVYVPDEVKWTDEVLNYLKDNTSKIMENPKSVIPVKIDTKLKGKASIDPILRRVKKNDRAIKQYKSECENKKIPYSMFAKFTGRSSYEVYSSLKLPMRENSDSSNSKLFQGVANKNGIVLDISALVSLQQAKAFDLIFSWANKIYVHQLVLDELIELFVKSSSGKESRTIHNLPKGKFTIYKVPDDEKQNYIDRIKEAIDFINDPRIEIIGSPVSSISLSSEEKEFNNIFPSVALASSKNACLIVDDSNLRNLVLSLGDTSAMPSIDFLRTATFKATRIKYNKITEVTKNLMNAGYPRIGLNLHDVDELLIQKEYDLLEQFCSDIKNNEYEIVSSIQVMSGAFIEIIKNEPEREDDLLWIFDSIKNHPILKGSMIQFFTIFLASFSTKDIWMFTKSIDFLIVRLHGEDKLNFLKGVFEAIRTIIKVCSSNNDPILKQWVSLLRAENILFRTYYVYRLD